MAEIKEGWEDAGNNMVRNKQTGQMVDQYHPTYTNYAQPIDNGPVENGGSGNPYAPPAQNTTTAGGQQTLRDALISQMTQNPIPQAGDEAVAAQVNPYKAAMDRQVNQQVRSEAERAFAGGQDYGVPERIAAAERAGQQSGLFESQVVGRELSARRDQIDSALKTYAGLLTGDQERALKEKLAQLDAQIRREGLSLQDKLGTGDLSLRRELGTGQLSNQLLGMLFQNGQFNANLARLFGLDEYNMNRDALLSLF